MGSRSWHDSVMHGLSPVSSALSPPGILISRTREVQWIKLALVTLASGKAGILAKIWEHLIVLPSNESIPSSLSKFAQSTFAAGC